MPKKVLSLQSRKPSGFIGRYIMTKIFSRGNANMDSLVIGSLDLREDDQVLEIGFGTGNLVKRIASFIKGGCIEGVDFSKAMLERARKNNKENILIGKVKLHNMDCKELSFPNESFTKICSSNTIYFWNSPKENFKEMLRVLKAKGKIVIGFRDEIQMNKLDLDKTVFNIYTKAEIKEMLQEVGFTKVTIEKEGEGLLAVYCAIAYKV
ncbi:MAG: class I SAM-dependent methyltransferase [Bacteroidales bacterium]